MGDSSLGAFKLSGSSSCRHTAYPSSSRQQLSHSDNWKWFFNHFNINYKHPPHHSWTLCHCADREYAHTLMLLILEHGKSTAGCSQSLLLLCCPHRAHSITYRQFFFDLWCSKGKGRQNFWDFFSHSSSYFAFSFLKISLSLFQCWVTACARRANELAAIQAVGENQSSNNFLCALSRLLAPYTHTAWHTIELKNESHSAVFFFSRDQ